MDGFEVDNTSFSLPNLKHTHKYGKKYCLDNANIYVS